MSESGWNFTGYTRFGFPFPYVGFGEKIGWSITDNQADIVDAYIEQVDFNTEDITYLYNGTHKQVIKRAEQLKVQENGAQTSKEYSFYKTHHGPLISTQDRKFLSVKMAKYETRGWLSQWL